MLCIFGLIKYILWLLIYNLLRLIRNVDVCIIWSYLFIILPFLLFSWYLNKWGANSLLINTLWTGEDILAPIITIMSLWLNIRVINGLTILVTCRYRFHLNYTYIIILTIIVIFTCLSIILNTVLNKTVI